MVQQRPWLGIRLRPPTRLLIPVDHITYAIGDIVRDLDGSGIRRRSGLFSSGRWRSGGLGCLLKPSMARRDSLVGGPLAAIVEMS